MEAPKTHHGWLTHPIRYSALLALVFLAGPGSIQGLAMLLAQAGEVAGLPYLPPQIHALLQAVGFFVLLIWGFLMHGLPGMLGTAQAATRHLRSSMSLLAIGLIGIWVSALTRASVPLTHAAWGLVLLGQFWGTLVILRATFNAQESWLERPFPFLILPLSIMPGTITLAFWQTGLAGPVTGASDLLVFGSVIPVIISMGYRMFSAMLSLRFPRDGWFDAGCLAWGIGAFAKTFGSAGLIAVWVGEVLLLIGAIAFLVGMRVIEPRRITVRSRWQTIDQPLLAHIRSGFVLLAAAPALGLAASLGIVPGGSFHWMDVGRHLATVGFALSVVMGLTQRVYPTFLRRRRSSPAWMWLNFALLHTGLALRLAEPFLPQSAPLVRLSAWFLYAAVLSYALHLARGLTVKSHEPLQPMYSRTRFESEPAQSSDYPTATTKLR